jgi:hypothetical protein
LRLALGVCLHWIPVVPSRVNGGFLRETGSDVSAYAESRPNGEISLTDFTRSHWLFSTDQCLQAARTGVELAVCSIPALLAMKGHALEGRYKQKHAYGIYLLHTELLRRDRCTGGSVPTVARPCLRRTGLRSIAERFDTADQARAFGPDWSADSHSRPRRGRGQFPSDRRFTRSWQGHIRG